MPDSPYRLKVKQFNQVCVFELTWGQEQCQEARLGYPALLTQLYEAWQQVYISFYTTAQTLDSIRGRVVGEVKLPASTVDLHAQLVQAEAALLQGFHRWLRGQELYEIRQTIALASLAEVGGEKQGVDVFLTCTPVDLARFPWESWEIGTDFTGTGATRIVRTPVNISGKPHSATKNSRRKQARILMIMGYGQGLDLQTDREIICSLGQKAEVQFIHWQPTESPTDIKNKIKQALTDAQGWDGLVFVGHSNETQITGGELAIAPGSSIQISEITHELTIAKENGLEFAIFNSCSGIKIAESLVRIGLSQVVVMREPILDSVAQEFLVQFVRNLGDYKNVQECLLLACQSLRLEKNFTYPSAYLVPSLFYHPGATLFQLQPIEPVWKKWGRKLLPSRLEAIALTACLTLLWLPLIQKTLFNSSSTLSAQDFLLDRRIWIQAIYREITDQVPLTSKPFVTLVQIDKESVESDGIAPEQIKPTMDRSYMSKIIDRLVAQNAKIIGIDFILDRQQKLGDIALRDTVQKAVGSQIWFIFAVQYSNGEEGRVNEGANFANRKWSLWATVNARHTDVKLLDPGDDCREVCPFSYLLSLVYLLNKESPISFPQPSLSNQANLRKQVLDFISQKEIQQSERLSALNQLRFPALSGWAYERLGQVWLRPIIDYSVPPNQVYNSIAAGRLLNSSDYNSVDLSDQVVIVASGGDYEESVDRHLLPLALRYWAPHHPSMLSGGEALAYMVHHLLTPRLVMPIPDIWLVGAAILLGRGVAIFLSVQQREQRWSSRRRSQYVVGLCAASILYGVAGLQIYIAAAVLLPLTFPTLMFWTYILPALTRRIDA